MEYFQKLLRIGHILCYEIVRVRHNFVFDCDAISATQLRFPAGSILLPHMYSTQYNSLEIVLYLSAMY